MVHHYLYRLCVIFFLLINTEFNLKCIFEFSFAEQFFIIIQYRKMLLYCFTFGVSYGFPWVVILFVYIVIIGILYFYEMLKLL